jgi:hypothetical protein
VRLSSAKDNSARRSELPNCAGAANHELGIVGRVVCQHFDERVSRKQMGGGVYGTRWI